MELVYLWVEGYKNIKEQGFNFSPRFECEYNKYSMEFAASIKKNYISVFPDNINITAIVGKNGSGKSNIFEALLSNLMYSMVPIDKPYKVLTFFYNKVDKKIHYKYMNSTLMVLNNEHLMADIGCLNKYKIPKKHMPFTFHYNYSLDWINNDESNLNFNKLYHKTDNYKTPILLQPNKSNGKISITNIDYLATRDILKFTIQNNKSFHFIEEFFIPKTCELSYQPSDIYKHENNIFNSKLEEIPPHWRIEHFREEAYYYILRKTIDKGKAVDFNFIDNIDFRNKLLEDSMEENFDDLIAFIKDSTFDDLYNDHIEYITRKIKDTFNFLTYIKDMETEPMGFDLLRGKKNIHENRELLLNLPAYVRVEFFDENDVSFYSLSYGQKFIIKFIYSLLAQLENLKSHTNYKDINLLLDEVEQGLHPEWQQKFLNLLIQTLKEFKDYNFNIIITSHSPFILSDIPKENVIFLEKGKQVDVDIETFGANNHTLLSHGFFMKDGLMGEFAKEKINETIKFLNKEQSKIRNEKEAKNIINKIGEPFLKEKLIELYDTNYSPSKEEQIQRLQKKIEELENADT